MVPPPAPPTGFKFTFSPSLSAFNIPVAEYLPTRLKNLPALRHAATGALVFSRPSGPQGEDKILLIQRAPHDSMPLKWEIPGGACDVEDETILHGLARELWEESGLMLRNVVRVVSEDIFFTRSGRLVEKVTFEAEVEGSGEGTMPSVLLDPQEHVGFLWATEEECIAGKVWDDKRGEEVGVEFTTKAQRHVILKGFRLRKEDREKGKDAKEAEE